MAQKFIYITDAVFQLPEDFTGTSKDAFKLFLEYALEKMPSRSIEYDKSSKYFIDKPLRANMDMLTESPDYRAFWQYCCIEDDEGEYI